MALYIETTGGASAWNVSIADCRSILKLTNIELLQADGEELELIRNKFNNVPITKGSICKWRGQLAQFIYDNL